MAESRRLGKSGESTEYIARPTSYNQQPGKPPVPNRPKSISGRPSVPSNGEVSNQSKRPNKTMPLLKKFGTSKNSSSRGSGGNIMLENGQSIKKNNRSNNANSQYTQLNEAKTRGPTIIRPGSTSNTNFKKKVAPPRPPPPKTGSHNGLPSYEEVLQSDINAFIGDRRRAPPLEIPLAPRPAVPNHRRLPPPINSHITKPVSPSLIDFDSTFTPSQPPPSRSTTCTFSNNKNLLDLDDIFSCSDFPKTSNVKQDDWSNLSSTSGGPSSSKNSGLGPTARPISNVNNGATRGEDWLQSCLQDNPTVDPWDKWPSDNGSWSNSPEPPSTSPPPVPVFTFDTEAPPLPPRPKILHITKPHAVALFDYTAQQSDELNFKTNETIMLVHRVNDDWFYGYTDRSAGLFPSNFVQILVPLPDTTSQKSSTVTGGPRCRAIYNFVGENDGDLSLQVGDVIVLLSKDQNDWFRGTLDGRTGHFPSTYVEIIQDLPTNINNDVQKVIKHGIALYDFNGEDGELTFSEGQKIVVSGRVNEEWLTGKVDGDLTSEGRFPSAFIQLLN